MKQSRDIIQEVTDKIIADLENGVPTWTKMWSGDGGVQGNAFMPFNLKSGKPYRGINVMILFGRSSSNAWLTYKQAKEMGGQVRKGEKGSKIVFWKPLSYKDKVTGEENTFPMMKAYTIFSYEQCEGLKELKGMQDQDTTLEQRYHQADELLEQANIKFGGSQPCYIPSLDEIHMPVGKTFKTTEDFYATALHELTHWTKHKNRVNRNMKSYALEELVAEIGAAYLCASLGIKGKLQHSEYIASWLQALKGDKKYIFQAAKEAQKASDFILGVKYIREEKAA